MDAISLLSSEFQLFLMAGWLITFLSIFCGVVLTIYVLRMRENNFQRERPRPIRCRCRGGTK